MRKLNCAFLWCMLSVMTVIFVIISYLCSLLLPLTDFLFVSVARIINWWVFILSTLYCQMRWVSCCDFLHSLIYYIVIISCMAWLDGSKHGSWLSAMNFHPGSPGSVTVKDLYNMCYWWHQKGSTAKIALMLQKSPTLQTSPSNGELCDV